jgi:hypothetical protein
MTPPPPLVCPHPGPRAEGPDCPLYAARVLLAAQREARLSAAIQREQSEVPSLADLIRLEAAQREGRRPTLPPGPPPTRPISILDGLKEAA